MNIQFWKQEKLPLELGLMSFKGVVFARCRVSSKTANQFKGLRLLLKLPRSLDIEMFITWASKSLWSLKKTQPRIMCATLNKNPWTTIVCPVNISDETDITNFYNRLSSFAWHIHKRNVLIIDACPVGWGCTIHRLCLCRGVRSPHPLQRVSWYDTKQSHAEYPFIAIAPRSTQARRGSTW